MRKLFRRIHYWFRRRQADAELAAEMEIHRAIKQRKLERSGMASADAAAASRRDLGNVLVAREDARGVWIAPWLDQLSQDIVYGLRMLRKNPGFTTVAVLSLALGIGANTGMFTLVNATFFRPLPVKDISTIFAVGTEDPTLKRTVVGFWGISFENFKDLRSRNHVFSDVAASMSLPLSGRIAKDAFALQGEAVTANYFDALGVQPIRGRTFLSSEAQEAVVSYRTWIDRFAADPRILGTEILLNSQPFRLVGVGAKDFKGTRNSIFGGGVEIWIPSGVLNIVVPDYRSSRRDVAWTAFARMKPDASSRQAVAEMKSIAAELEMEFPADNLGRAFRLERLSDYAHFTYSGSLVAPLAGLLMIAFGIVLLVACLNLANLLLAKATQRQTEVSIRVALGGSRGRLIRQLLTESVMLALIGGVAGFFAAYWTLKLLPAGLGFDPQDLALDIRVLAFTFTLSLMSGILFWSRRPSARRGPISLAPWRRKGARE